VDLNPLAADLKKSAARNVKAGCGKMGTDSFSRPDLVDFFSIVSAGKAVCPHFSASC
jgi:hypothetical protein